MVVMLPLVVLLMVLNLVMLLMLTLVLVFFVLLMLVCQRPHAGVAWTMLLQFLHDCREAACTCIRKYLDRTTFFCTGISS